MIRRPRSAFTLIELLICVGILLIIAPIAMEIIGRLDSLRQRRDDRNEVFADGNRALAFWREDIALARSVAPGEGGRSLSIDRATTSGQTLIVQYAPDDEGRLVRSERTRADAGTDAPAERIPLTNPIQDLRFEAAGRGWRATWTGVASDGLQTWRWPVGGEATPLLAEASAAAAAQEEPQ